MGNPLALSGDDPSDQVLEDGVAGRHDVACGKVLQDLPQKVT
jgi:hypothetical protein